MNNNYEGYSKPYGYTELLEDLLRFKDFFKENITVEFMGTSVKGRLIPLVKIGEGKQKILLAGSVHGREFVSTAFLMRSIYELLKSGEELRGKCLYVVPMLNPDGVEIALSRDNPMKTEENFKAEFYKNNANNINLNANFPFCFGKVSESRQGGKTAASEPETKALISLCEKEGFEFAVALHARGNCIFWQDAGNGKVRGDLELAKSLEKNCGFELIAPTKSPKDYSGGFENWFRCRYKKPALCVELVKDEEIDFSDMCRSFDEAVMWQRTQSFLETCLNFS